MILLWGLATDEPLAFVRAALERAEIAHRLVDQRAVLDTGVELAVDGDVGGWISIGSERIDLQEVTAAYVRPYESDRLPAVEAAGFGSPAWRHAVEIEDALVTWCEITPARVVNRPSAMGSNNAKPFQAAQIRAAGLNVPDTLVTTNAAAARAFWDEHGEVVYKSVSGVRSIVSRLRPEHLTRLERVADCPTQFQAFVPGHDVRIHVVADEIYACEIRSEADDYRYGSRDGRPPEIEPIEVPETLATQCRTMVAQMGLWFAGIDFRRTPDGDYVCLEVNPSPGFSFYERMTGEPIARAVAALLADANGDGAETTSRRAAAAVRA